MNHSSTLVRAPSYLSFADPFYAALVMAIAMGFGRFALTAALSRLTGKT